MWPSHVSPKDPHSLGGGRSKRHKAQDVHSQMTQAAAAQSRRRGIWVSIFFFFSSLGFATDDTSCSLQTPDREGASNGECLHVGPGRYVSIAIIFRLLQLVPTCWPSSACVVITGSRSKQVSQPALLYSSPHFLNFQPLESEIRVLFLCLHLSLLFSNWLCRSPQSLTGYSFTMTRDHRMIYRMKCMMKIEVSNSEAGSIHLLLVWFNKTSFVSFVSFFFFVRIITSGGFLCTHYSTEFNLTISWCNNWRKQQRWVWSNRIHVFILMEEIGVIIFNWWNWFDGGASLESPLINGCIPKGFSSGGSVGEASWSRKMKGNQWFIIDG
jgi:hypothetical protein